MRRAALLALELALWVGVAPALASHRPPSGISGVVRNTTCPGPCREPPPPPPLYTGDGLVVKIRNLETHQLVAALHPTDGRFAVDAGPGRYHVHALIRQSGQRSQGCWKGSAKNVGILDQGVRVRLTVTNQCVV